MQKRKIRIAGTGCALADYLYPDVSFHSSAFLHYISRQPGDGGLSPGKLVFTEELERFAGCDYFHILREITGGKSPASFNVGGPGLVSLIHVAQMIESEDFEVYFYGRAGFDETAERIYEMLRKTPLNFSHYVKAGDKPTPFTDVFSDPEYDNGHGERTFVNNIGAAWDLVPDELPDEFFRADIVCLGGTAIVPRLHDNLTLLLRRAKENGSITVVNTVFDFRSEKSNPGEKWPLVDNDQFGLIDVLVMDHEEALKISGTGSGDEAAKYFESSGVASFVITNGAGLISAFSNGRLFRKMALSKLPVSERVASSLNRAGDTTGCGDNFAGGLIASLARQLIDRNIREPDLMEALSWAVASGGFACFYIGGTWFESHPGQKREYVDEYRQAWLKQISKL